MKSKPYETERYSGNSGRRTEFSQQTGISAGGLQLHARVLENMKVVLEEYLIRMTLMLF